MHVYRSLIIQAPVREAYLGELEQYALLIAASRLAFDASRAQGEPLV